MQTADYQPLEQEQYVLEENGALRPPAPPPPELLPSVERMVAENPRLARALLAIALVSVLVLAIAFAPRVHHAPAPSPSMPAMLRDANRVLLISIDGFRADYLGRPEYNTSAFQRVAAEGTTAQWLQSSFPTVTFPNHYSLATGLFPAYHGIIGNSFYFNNTWFNMQDTNPWMWIGEPIWETATRWGKYATTTLWPGSECVPAVCAAFGGAGGRTVSGSSPHADLVAHTLAYLAQPQPPDFLTLYFSDVDHAGHGYGPDSPAVGAAVGAVNAALDALLAGMAALGVLDSTHLLLVSDHGMAPTCAARRVILDDLLAATTEYGSLGAGGVAAALDAVRRNGTGWTGGTSVALPAASPAAARALAAQMSASPAAFDADGSRVFAAYAKQDLPQPRMGGFGDSGRVPAVVGVPYVGWTVATAASLAACKGGPDRCCGCGGSHGFDNAYQAMAALFIGRGPRFAPGALVPGFTPNVELYNVMADILDIPPTSNNGTAAGKASLLLPRGASVR